MNKLFLKFFENDEKLVNLVIFRFLYSIIIALQLILKFKMFDFQFVNNQYRMLTGFDYFFETIFGFDGYYLLKYLLIFMMLLTALGVGNRRVIYITSGLSFLFLYPLVMVNSLQSMALIPITFFAIASSEYGASPIFNLKQYLNENTRIPNINIEVLVYVFATTYFLAGMSKTINNKEAWMIGDGARGALLHVYLLSDVPLALDAFKLFSKFSIFSWGIILFQVSFIFLAMIKKVRHYLILLGSVFHIGVYVLFKINFFEYYFISYLVFVNWYQVISKIIYFKNKSTN